MNGWFEVYEWLEVLDSPRLLWHPAYFTLELTSAGGTSDANQSTRVRVDWRTVIREVGWINWL